MKLRNSGLENKRNLTSPGDEERAKKKKKISNDKIFNSRGMTNYAYMYKAFVCVCTRRCKHRRWQVYFVRTVDRLYAWSLLLDRKSSGKVRFLRIASRDGQDLQAIL